MAEHSIIPALADTKSQFGQIGIFEKLGPEAGAEAELVDGQSWCRLFEQNFHNFKRRIKNQTVLSLADNFPEALTRKYQHDQRRFPLARN